MTLAGDLIAHAAQNTDRFLRERAACSVGQGSSDVGPSATRERCWAENVIREMVNSRRRVTLRDKEALVMSQFGSYAGRHR